LTTFGILLLLLVGLPFLNGDLLEIFVDLIGALGYGLASQVSWVVKRGTLGARTPRRGVVRTRLASLFGGVQTRLMLPRQTVANRLPLGVERSTFVVAFRKKRR
jgi:hypothetical protein